MVPFDVRPANFFARRSGDDYQRTARAEASGSGGYDALMKALRSAVM